MKTLLTKHQQEAWLDENSQNRSLCHKWSTRGYGKNSKIVNMAGDTVGRAGGCGYDRRGAAFGRAIASLFPTEILRLARMKAKGRRRTYKQAEGYYGLFYNAVINHAWVDGACGFDQMRRILQKIGFDLEYVGESEHAQSGEQFYRLVPVTSRTRKYWREL